jgi:hypothetical protein
MSGKEEFRKLFNSNQLSVQDIFSVLNMEFRDELAVLHMKNIGKESSKELYDLVYPKSRSRSSSKSSSRSSSRSTSKKKKKKTKKAKR